MAELNINDFKHLALVCSWTIPWMISFFGILLAPLLLIIHYNDNERDGFFKSLILNKYFQIISFAFIIHIPIGLILNKPSWNFENISMVFNNLKNTPAFGFEIFIFGYMFFISLFSIYPKNNA